MSCVQFVMVMLSDLEAYIPHSYMMLRFVNLYLFYSTSVLVKMERQLAVGSVVMHLIILIDFILLSDVIVSLFYNLPSIFFHY